MVQHKKLESLLQERAFEAPDSRLENRILAAAAMVSKRRNAGFTSLWGALYEFILPKPAYVLAATLLLGVLVGWQNNTDITNADSASSTFIYDEGSML